MRVLIVTVGSGGDVHPFLAVGRALAARGAEVRVMTNPHFAATVEGAGLPLVPIGTEEEYLAAVKHPDLIHPIRGPMYVLNELVLTRAEEMYVLTRKVIRDWRPDVVLRHHIAFGAAWAAEREHVKQAAAVLAPVFWLNWRNPSVFGSVPVALPPMLSRARLSVSSAMGRWLIDRPCNAIRAKIGMAPIRNMFWAMSRESDLNLGLWSPTFRGPTEGDPQRGHIVGFASYDGAPTTASDPATQRLRAFIAGGPAPVVFTLGTSVAHHAGNFYKMAAEVCSLLGLRAVFAGLDASEVEPRASLCAIKYVPFKELFPLAAAIVHHGGVGTTGACLRAGKPQVVVAYANDEFDNAARVARLGCGAACRAVSVLRQPMSAAKLRTALEAVLRPEVSRRAAEVGGMMASEDGAVRAAELVTNAASAA